MAPSGAKYRDDACAAAIIDADGLSRLTLQVATAQGDGALLYGVRSVAVSARLPVKQEVRVRLSSDTPFDV